MLHAEYLKSVRSYCNINVYRTIKENHTKYVTIYIKAELG